MAKTPPSNLVYVPGVTKVLHHENNDNLQKSENSNDTAIQLEGHLALPKVVVSVGVQEKDEKDEKDEGTSGGDKHSNTTGGESGEEDAHHIHGM